MTMDEDRRDPEIETMLKDVKLKEPSQKEMADFVSAVHGKIHRGIGHEGLGFRQVAVIFVAGLALGGLIYLVFARPRIEPLSQPDRAMTVIASEAPLEVRTSIRGEAKQSKDLGVASAPVSQLARNDESLVPERGVPHDFPSLSVDQEFAVLEAFEDQFSNEALDLFGDSEVFFQLSALDEIETSTSAPPQTRAV